MADLTPGPEPDSVTGGYRIESCVARGGMGVIYRATQLGLERTVALKVVAPELAHDEAFRERFKREARLAAGLDHPNILPVYEAGEVDGRLFLAMRYVVGTDMDTLIGREGKLAPARAVAIVAQVASALDAAHSRGLVHRDVKPGNILIAEEYGEERAYLTDFGLTKSSGADAHLTRTGVVVGTLDYVAPEQVQGGAVDGRADTYALACVLYHAVTGAVPFDRPGDVAKMWAHLNDPPPSAMAASPVVSPALDGVIRRGMAKLPDERYASSGEFAREARSALGAGPDAAPAEPVATAPTQVDAPVPAQAPAAQPPPARAGAEGSAPPSRRRPMYAATVLAAAALVVAAIVIVASSSGGGHGSTTPASTIASTTTALPLTTISTSSPTTSTTTDPAAAQAAAYHAQVARIIPRMRAVFRRFPRGSDFGKPVFSRTCLAVAAGLRGIADNLDALSPPAAALVDHEALVTHLHEMEAAFRSLAADSDNRDFTGAQGDLERTKVALAKINVSVRRVLRQR
jgi:serine/threonine protein kinase